MGFYYTSVPLPIVKQNGFFAKPTDIHKVSFAQVQSHLPRPVLEKEVSLTDAYWFVWKQIFDNVCHPTDANGFVNSYLDPAFNECFLLWNSAFTSHYSYYARHIFPFEDTLNNFYAKQHGDGFICRQIRRSDGQEAFEKHDPSSSGPNILAWTEYNLYKRSGDLARLRDTFVPILGLHRWLKKFRTWKDGSYWANGWSNGMSNQPRQRYHGYANDPHFDHGFLSWADTTVQQYISAKVLIETAALIGSEEDISDLHQEKQRLAELIMTKMYCHEQHFLFDLDENGERTDVKSIGAFWLLHTDLLSNEQVNGLVSHLTEGGDFFSEHPIPSLSRKDPDFCEKGNFWRGGVWAPLNYMVLEGLVANGYDDLAHQISRKHINMVLETFNQTGTLWENYKPTQIGQGVPAKPNFLGWTGLSLTNILYEHFFGIRIDPSQKTIRWHIVLTEKHGVQNLVLENGVTVSLVCEMRENKEAPPLITYTTPFPVTYRLEITNFEAYEIIIQYSNA